MLIHQKHPLGMISTLNLTIAFSWTLTPSSQEAGESGVCFLWVPFIYLDCLLLFT